jgi:hypothetical protein
MKHLSAIIILLAVVLVGGVDARPEYAAAESLDCVACHDNPAGGGPLNPRGVHYLAHDYNLSGFTGGDPQQPPVTASPLWLVKSLLTILTLLAALAAVIVIYSSRPAARQDPSRGKQLRRGHRIYGWITLGLYLALTVICLVAHGVRGNTTRVLLHSIIGFVGLPLFAAKVWIVRQRWKLWRVCHYLGGALLAVNLAMFALSAWWYLIGRFA